MKLARPAWLAVADGFGLGLAAGFYFWIISRPHHANVAIIRTSQPGLLAGLTPRLATAILAGVAVSAVFSLTPDARVWRARLSLASCALYGAALLPIAGPIAIPLSAGAALIGLIALFGRDDVPESGATLVALHVGAFSMAIAFFDQWPWYATGWAPFLDSLAALKTLWLGG